MVKAYNFLASWQLFPEKCSFEWGHAPKSGICKIETDAAHQQLSITTNWVTLDNSAFVSEYDVRPNEEWQPFSNQELADKVWASFENASCLSILFQKADVEVLAIKNEILPNGYLKVTHRGTKPDGGGFVNIEVYHKQMSVLPYASSVGSVAIRPTEEGAIKHKALQAMEEQTNMQLDQIRQQIELLARQAQELRKRKELSLMIYSAKLSFSPIIGQTYYMYEKRDGSHVLSLISPKEWGSGPFKQFEAAVKLLADHTWMEVEG
jgi:hypothetical protein